MLMTTMLWLPLRRSWSLRTWMRWLWRRLLPPVAHDQLGQQDGDFAAGVFALELEDVSP